MRTICIAFACLLCLGHARRVKTASEAHDWELENLERYHAGELNDATLGMTNFMRSLNDPSILSEVMKMINDPEVQQLMADPMFQKQVTQAMQAYTPSGTGGAREWELANLVRHHTGDIDEAELGMANLRQAFSDPSVFAEALQLLNDPEILAQFEEKLADPAFQEQARQDIAARESPPKQLATLLFAMSTAQSQSATSSRGNVKMETNADLQALAKKLNPAIGYFDPLNLGADGPDGRSEPLIGFLRHAEIKHGRVSMAAFIGFCVQSNGIRWGFEPFNTITTNSPLEQWDALPPSTRWNLILGVGFLEGWGELRGTGEPHYMRGGKPGYYPNFDEIPKDTLSGWYPGLNLWDPLKIYGKQSPETKARRLVVELNNGRLAMLAIMSFISEAKLPGSIPMLKGLVAPYKGDLVFPPGQYAWVGDFHR